MNFLIFFILFISLETSALEVSLKNDREGKSYFDSRSMRKSIEKVLKEISPEIIIGSFEKVLEKSNEENICSFRINRAFQKLLKEVSPQFENYEGALYYLRQKNEIDDVVLNILLKAHATDITDIHLPKNEDDLWLPSDEKKLPDLIELIGSSKRKLVTGCLDETYKNLSREMLKIHPALEDYHVEALLVEAYQLKRIDYNNYLWFEKARVNELEKLPIDLKQYLKKKKSLRSSYPLKNPEERSDFIAAEFSKKKSRRQHLMESYTDLQIMLMGNIVKKLRTRLESPKVEILVYEKSDVGEVITLEPMERFRFAIKILRKEMKMLALNTYFKGQTPAYLDLMISSFETGIVSSEEINEIASLEELWNPKKTFWEKARFWVQSFGAIATIVIPPPYGFIPALSLVVIEATTGKKDNTENDIGLF